MAALISEPAANDVRRLLKSHEDPARISAVNVAEAVDSISRLQGWPSQDVVEKLRWLVVGGMIVEPVTESLAFDAAALRTRHYHRERRPISIPDCIALALALDFDDRLATSDPALLETARAENCRVVVLPDSQGRIAD